LRLLWLWFLLLLVFLWGCRLIIGLVVGVIAAIGGVIAAVVAGVTVAIVGLFNLVASVVQAVLRMVAKIVTAPFMMCAGNREPPSPLGIALAINAKIDSANSHVHGQIVYRREEPPSYSSFDPVNVGQIRK
jgi:hypothetical protein